MRDDWVLRVKSPHTNPLPMGEGKRFDKIEFIVKLVLIKLILIYGR